jgi:hypothetical protein
MGSNGNTASGTTLTVNPTYTSGDTVFIWTSCNGAPTTQTITDGTNTYTQIGSSITAGGGDVVAVFQCISAAAGSPTVTMTIGTARAFRQIGYIRYSGLTGSATQAGQFQGAPGTGTNAITSGNVTISSQPALLLGISYDFNGSTITAGTGFTSRGAMTTGDAINGTASLFEDLRKTNTTATAATFTTVAGGASNFITFGIWCAESGAVVTTPGPLRLTLGMF